MEYAFLASDVYDAPTSDYTKDLLDNIFHHKNYLKKFKMEREKRLKKEKHNIRLHGWQDLYDHPGTLFDGFFARLYGNKNSKDAVIAYRGTLPDRIDNLAIDLQLALRLPSIYQFRALKFYRKSLEILRSWRNFKGHLSLTGHSLGGYLAQYVSIMMKNGDIPVVVFNAPKIGDALLPWGHRVHHNRPYPKFINVDVVNDKIHKVGYKIGKQYIVSGPSYCSSEKIFKSFTHPDSIREFITGIGKVPLKITECAIEEHKIGTIIRGLSHKYGNLTYDQP